MAKHKLSNQLKQCLLFFILLPGLLLTVAYRSAEDPFQAILQKLKEYNQKYPQEKIHLHLDKPYYAAGDDIWLKAYLINTLSSAPSALSGSMYVDLIDAQDSIKKQLKLPIIAGVSWGSFKLPDTLSEGNYRIRAYTQWMKNAGPEFFFDKTLKIGNSLSNDVFTHTSYQYRKQNVNANIRFSDKKGTLYTQHEVAYEVKLNSKSIKKGKATTNEKGELDIDFSNDDQNKTGIITASFLLPDNQKITKIIPIKSLSNHTDVQFFPESGNLVSDLPNKLGIKAVNSAGMGEDISGTIVDNTGKVLTPFSTKHIGMGSVIFTPKPGKTYVAKVKYNDGSEGTVKLPDAVKSGYILSIDQNADNLLIKVLISSDLLNKGDLKLVAQHNSNVQLFSKANDQKPEIAAVISKKEFPSGIVQFSLFSPDNLPVCERLVFVNNPLDRIAAQISSAKNSYKPKENVVLDFEATADHKPIQGSFSVAVTNTSAVIPDEENESNILTSMLLTSDLTGYIEKPNYYFQENQEKTAQDLDNLLLTQGWRRVLWKNVIGNTNASQANQPENFLRISGTITTSGGKPIANSKVSIFPSSDITNVRDTVTDALGRFNFERMTFADNTKFMIQAKTPGNDKNLQIVMDVASGQVISSNKNTGDLEVNVNEAIASYLKQTEGYFDQLTKSGRLERTVNLKEVKVSASKKVLIKHSSNLNGPGNADEVITGNQLQTCPTIARCLEARVIGLQMKDGVPYLMRNGSTSPMLIILDGRKVDASSVMNLSPFDLEGIEVLKEVAKTAIYGFANSNSGVLILTSKVGDEDNSSSKKSSPDIITFSPRGYDISREFYSPVYQPENSATAIDQRSTIYWNPNIVTDAATGKAKLSYFNASDPGIYRVVIEGIDMTGKLARAIYTYEVK